jgi:hypothetical protein
MQANQISLSVDVANDETVVTEAYDRYEEFQNRSVYIGADHVPEARNMFALYRTFASKSGNFKGVSKSAIKFTQDVEVPGVDSSTTLTAPGIIDVAFSFPVGMTAAEVLHLRMRVVAALLDDSFMDSLNIQQMV